ncbi:MAG: (4Fe-4S)-binding protein [Ruminococcaceae bacterium]|nr:(4Fe-4S)-binding protein [Oscillospiraceae bacterium]
MSITKEDITSVKGRGFLLNRGTECFSGRVVSIGGLFTADDLSVLAECAKKFGSGDVAFTSRLSAEIIGIPFDKIPEAEAFMAEHGLFFGGTGAKVRPITACKGTTCIFGIIDTRAMAKTIHERFYIGMRDVALPHKFKISVGGCPNSCMKPSLNDVGVEGCRQGGVSLCRVFVGGTWGRTLQRQGTALSTLYKAEEIPDLIEKVLLFYRENGIKKERLGALIDRVGIETLEAAIATDDLLLRRNEILSLPLNEG